VTRATLPAILLALTLPSVAIAGGCPDADGDGYDDITCGGDDCNDAFDFINPGATEVCGDAIDQDCSGIDEQPDADFDGHDSVPCGGDDCFPDDPLAYPGVDEDEDGADVCEDCDDDEPLAVPGGDEICDGLDSDCSGVIDDLDADGDGDFPVACGGTDCDDSDPSVGAGTDDDSDGFDACVDCDDDDDTIFPGAAEVCDDVDTDCDGLADGLDFDVGGTSAPPVTVSAGAGSSLFGCFSSVFVTAVVSGAGADVFDLDVTFDALISPTTDLFVTLSSPAGTSVTLFDGVGDGVGGDFAGTVLDDDAITPIADGAPPFAGSYQPADPLAAFYGEDPNGAWQVDIYQYCLWFGSGLVNEVVLDFELGSLDDVDGDGWNACGDCDSADADAYPGAPEVCIDGIDQDCDGADATGDLDGDGYIDANCGGPDCDDSDPDINPGATEIACDGVDNDCDTLMPCQPCSQGSPIESGSVAAGFHEFVGSLDTDDEIYGQIGLYRFDIYRFVAGSSGLYTFDLSSSEFDAYLEMYNSGCEYGGSNDNGGDGTNANLGLFLFEGEIFHIVTTSAQQLETGGYAMNLLVL